MLRKDQEDIQFTLTCKDDVAIAEFKERLYKFLRPLDQKHIVFFSAIEISPNLRYHVHGYCSKLDTSSKVNQVRMRLFAWKRRYGYVQVSFGPLESWHKYCTKGPIHIYDNSTYLTLKKKQPVYVDLDTITLRLLPEPNDPEPGYIKTLTGAAESTSPESQSSTSPEADHSGEAGLVSG